MHCCPDANLRGALQHRALAQRHRLCDAQDMLAGRQAEIHAARDGKLGKKRVISGSSGGQGKSLLADSSNTITMTSQVKRNRLCRDATMLRINLVELIAPDAKPARS